MRRPGELEWAGAAGRPQRWGCAWPCGSWSLPGLLVRDPAIVSIASKVRVLRLIIPKGHGFVV